MRGAVTPQPQYAFMAWCSVKKAQGQLNPRLTLPYLTLHNSDMNRESVSRLFSMCSLSVYYEHGYNSTQKLHRVRILA